MFGFESFLLGIDNLVFIYYAFGPRFANRYKASIAKCFGQFKQMTSYKDTAIPYPSKWQ